jgi:2'-5' RNA ligase
MDVKRYILAIIPPDEITAQAIAVSRALEPCGSCFILGGATRFPHVTLYHANFSSSGLLSVIASLRVLAQATTPFLIRQLTYYPDQGIWVGVRFVADKALLDLHSAVIAATREYRHVGEDVDYKEHWVELPPHEYKNIEYCGWAHSFALYSPHLTFTRLKQPQTNVLAHLGQPEFSFRVDHIGLFEAGDYGTCTRRVADFWFRPEPTGEQSVT